MPRQAIAFSTNEQRSKPLDAARLVNLFPEVPPLGSRAPALIVGQNNPLKSVLYGTPGLQAASVTKGTGGPVRALRFALGYMWALIEQTLYRIDSTLTATACTGDTIAAASYAMFTDNGTQIALLVNGDTFLVGDFAATFSFDVTGGTLTAGTNKITGITINSVQILSAAIDWSDSNAATAAAIVSNINAFITAPKYTATAVGQTVVISAAAGSGTAPNTFAVAPAVAGDFTVSPTSGTMQGGQTTATTVTKMVSSSTVAYPTAGASSIDYIDGFTVWTAATAAATPSSTPNTGQWFISGLYNTAQISALDFATAESSPDSLLRVLVDHREIWLFGTNSIEIWTNVGASPFPFQRIPGAVLERGCAAALSPAKADNAVMWLGDDLIVYQARGYQPVRISTYGVEDVIRQMTSVSDAYGFTYSQGGHVFYVLTFPTGMRTFVWDLSNGNTIHERQTGTTLTPATWKVTCTVNAFGKIYAGYAGGKICVLDMDTYTEAGNAIRRVAVTPPFYAAGKRAIISQVEVEMEVGDGIDSGQGSDPQMMLRISKDGSAIYGNQMTAFVGKTGVRQNRVMFRRLGVFRQAALEFSISDPIRICIFGLRYESRVMGA